ncbi:MAG TPA: phosphotransferase [Microlunatus sp.]
MRSADWLADRFGLGGPATLEGPVDRGFQGQVWRLTCGARAYAVKEALVPLDDDQVVAAYTLQQRAEVAGVIAPRQLLTVAGDPAVQIDGETLRVFEWVELAAPDRGLEPTGLGRLLAALHTVGGPGSGAVDPWFTEPVGRDHWGELVAELHLAGAPFATTLDDLTGDLADSEAILESPPDVIVCHRDLWADNLRAGADGSPVVIDWDTCGPASMAGELAMVLVEFGTSPGRARDLYTAYVDAGGPARITGVGDFTMPIAVLHHIVELGARQWLAASGEVARRRAAGRVTEFTDDPFRLVDVGRLLDAVMDGPCRRPG